MYFLYPVPKTSKITQTYKQHVDRAKDNNWTNYNGGIDWAVSMGTRVAAAQSGKIAVARKDAGGYGIHVRIQHAGGYLTIYGHLQSYLVVQEQSINAGEIIGLSDNTGNSTGPHLHFEARLNNVAFDPMPYLVDTLPDAPPVDNSPFAVGDHVVTIAALNVRVAPSLTAKRLFTLSIGDKLTVVEVSADGLWLKVVHDEWVYAQYVKKE